MNEQIRLLADQANGLNPFFGTLKNQTTLLGDGAVEKFALLIVDQMLAITDAQAEYTKKAAKVGMDTFTSLSGEMVKASQEAMKFDYTKFGEGIMKAYTAQGKK